MSQAVQKRRQIVKKKAKPARRIDNAVPVQKDLIEPTLEKGKKLLQQGHLNASDQIFRILARNGIEGLYGMGLVRLRAGHLNEAAAYFHRCIQVDNRHANSYFYLGHIFERLKSLKNAQGLYLRALSLKPGHAAAQARLIALENYRGGKTSKADHHAVPKSSPVPGDIETSSPVSPSSDIREVMRSKFIAELNKKGFKQSPRSERLFYCREDANVRFVITKHVARFEKRKKDEKWQLWKWHLWESYLLTAETESALKVINNPNTHYTNRGAS
jgi:tetratricopeptide (TPR) repeat protein